MKQLILFLKLSFIFSMFSSQAALSKTECLGECWIQDYIDPVSDFPIKGILFQWYRPLLSTPQAFAKTIKAFADHYKGKGIEGIVALDSRGFIFGSALAHEIGAPLVLVRKAGKLPPPTYSIDYALEYGKDKFELEKKALKPGQKVIVIDDVVATGGTMLAAAKLVRMAGAEVVEAATVMDLPPLKGKEALQKEGVAMFSLVSLFVD